MQKISKKKVGAIICFLSGLTAWVIVILLIFTFFSALNNPPEGALHTFTCIKNNPEKNLISPDEFLIKSRVKASKVVLNEDFAQKTDLFVVNVEGTGIGDDKDEMYFMLFDFENAEYAVSDKVEFCDHWYQRSFYVSSLKPVSGAKGTYKFSTEEIDNVAMALWFLLSVCIFVFGFVLICSGIGEVRDVKTLMYKERMYKERSGESTPSSGLHDK